jgi:hypothetical protein
LGVRAAIGAGRGAHPYVVGTPLVIYWFYDAPTGDYEDWNFRHFADVALHFFAKTRLGADAHCAAVIDRLPGSHSSRGFGESHGGLAIRVCLTSGRKLPHYKRVPLPGKG